jgi:type I restriction enzyme S subunit
VIQNLVLGESIELLIDNRGKNPPFITNGIPALSGVSVSTGTIDYSSARCVSEDIWRSWMPSPLQRNDVILTSEAPLGRVALVPDNRPLVLAQRLFGLRGKVGILDSRFLYYALQTERVQADLQGRATGTTVLGIRQPALMKVQIPAPEYAQQVAIAEVLGALDDKIAANTKLAAACEELALTMVSGTQSTVTLQDVAELSKTQTDPSSLDTPVVDHYSLPAYDEGVVPERANPTDIKSSKFRVESPSVLVSKLNPRFPRIWNVSKISDRPALASTEFLVLNPRFSTTAVLWACLRQPGFSRELESKVAGTSGSHQRVKPQGVLESYVVDPRSIPTRDQETVTNLVSRSDMARRESIELAATRDALLPQLMVGKLRVKDAEALVAEAV